MAGTEVAEEGPRPSGRGIERRRAIGYLFGVLTAACWASSPVFLRKGLDIVPSPMWAVTVGLAAATLPFVIWFGVVRPEQRIPLRRMKSADPRSRVALGFLLLAGLASAAGAIGRTVAIDLAPVVVVVPLLQTTSLWTIALAPPLLGRHVERVTPRLVAGALLVLAGASLVIVGQNA